MMLQRLFLLGIVASAVGSTQTPVPVPPTPSKISGLYMIDWYYNLFKIDLEFDTKVLIKALDFFGKDEIQMGGSSDIDSQRGIFYTLGINVTEFKARLWGIDVSTGDLVVNLQVPQFELESFVGAGQYVDVDSSTGDVYISGRSASVGSKHLTLKYDYSTKALTIAAAFAGGDFADGSSTFDWQNQRIWVEVVLNNSISAVYGVDVQAGDVSDVITNTYNIETFEFDET
eukprot:TRINITY_DN12172_c0_g1_i1.p1 TRINITY_DN12172_c0_g1~~TRINITY_DN12172_c0_g1_i1.p1  ORF type:complete len:229 (+),score=36.66 TRINITY_DN12172_c0_g1_i1:66-752(+)